jgi:acyl-CoA synthetase (NDP forming)
VVGANDRLLSALAVPEIQRSAAEVSLVSRTHSTLYGQTTVSSLAGIGHPVDTVLVMTGAETAVQITEEAAHLGCGGVIVIGGGFAEAGPEGALRQLELVDLAHNSGMALIGPNCLGFVNASAGVYCSLIGHLPLRPGNVAVLAQSGYLLRAALNAGHERQLGFSHAVSSGNEAVVDVLDLIDHAIADDATRVICLVLEKIPSWEGLVEAASRARAAAKPIVALKLGRSERARSAIQSHTGAIASAGWVYEVAFRQAGILTAIDLDDLLDQVQLLAGLPHDRWVRTSRIAIVANSGGTASLAADIAADKRELELPELLELQPWLRERLGPQALPNPLDLTGAALSDVTLLQEIFEQYGQSSDVDAVLFCSGLAAHDEQRARPLEALCAAADAAEDSTLFIATCAEASALADWLPDKLKGSRVGHTRGFASALRALDAMNRYLDSAASEPIPMEMVAGTERLAAEPAATETYSSGETQLLRFAPGMRLLREFGIETAPYVVLGGESATDDVSAGALGSQVVVKLADVPHRTDIGAVRVGVPAGSVVSEAAALQRLAEEHSAEDTVVCQALVHGTSELLVGLKSGTEFGTVLVLGLGGVAVEQSSCVVGRVLPLTAPQREELVDELGNRSGLASARAGALWDRSGLLALVTAVEALAQACPWLDSLDLNPVLLTTAGPVAVDVVATLSVMHGRSDHPYP